MPRSASIGTRVFGLSVLLLMLMIILSVYNSQRAEVIREELIGLTRVAQPLATELALIDVSGARRRLAFTRLCGQWEAGGTFRSNAEAAENHVLFDHELDSLIASAIARLSGPGIRTGTHASTLDRITTGLVDLDQARSDIGSLQERILKGLVEHEGEGDPALEMEHSLRQTMFQEERSALRDLAISLAEKMASNITDEQQRLLRTSRIVTVLAVLLGLAAAWVITRQLVRPVRFLLGGVARVEHGDLDVHVPVTSGDEIGDLTTSFNRMVVELKGKQRMRETFGRYVDPRVVEKLLSTGHDVSALGMKQEMTVVFADIVGFTPLSEHVDPERLVTLLNAHFTRMAHVLHAHGAVVDKYMGDSVMAYWGAPFIPEEQQAIRACLAAFEQVRLFDATVDRWPTTKEGPRATPGMCIGIASGEMVVGNIGSERAMSWTVIGETVNLAARLEKLNREHGTRILVSQRTHDLACSHIRFRAVGSVPVKGFSRSPVVYEALGPHTDADLSTFRSVTNGVVGTQGEPVVQRT